MVRVLGSDRLRGVAVLGVATGILLGSASASAFCRRTTCQPAFDTCRTDADGCETTGTPLFWSDQCVTFSMQRDGSSRRSISAEQAQASAEAAFASWLGSRCAGGFPSIGVLPYPQSFCDIPEYNYDPPAPNANVIMFRDDDWPYAGESNTIALTTISFDTVTGQIFDADIEINSFGTDVAIFDGTTMATADLQAVLTHEIGHLLGLDHSPGDSQSSMYPSYQPTDLSIRTPSADDQAGLCTIYPPDPTFDHEVCPVGTQPRHGFGRVCSSVVTIESGCAVRSAPGSSPRAPWVLGLCVAAAAAWVRRRQRAT